MTYIKQIRPGEFYKVTFEGGNVSIMCYVYHCTDTCRRLDQTLVAFADLPIEQEAFNRFCETKIVEALL